MFPLSQGRDVSRPKSVPFVSRRHSLYFFVPLNRTANPSSPSHGPFFLRESIASGSPACGASKWEPRERLMQVRVRAAARSAFFGSTTTTTTHALSDSAINHTRCSSLTCSPFINSPPLPSLLLSLSSSRSGFIKSPRSPPPPLPFSFPWGTGNNITHRSTFLISCEHV